jgi:hypothetical protein
MYMHIIILFFKFFYVYIFINIENKSKNLYNIFSIRSFTLFNLFLILFCCILLRKNKELTKIKSLKQEFLFRVIVTSDKKIRNKKNFITCWIKKMPNLKRLICKKFGGKQFGIFHLVVFTKLRCHVNLWQIKNNQIFFFE